MSQIAKKMMIPICITLFFVTLCCIGINYFFIEKLYLSQQIKEVEHIYRHIVSKEMELTDDEIVQYEQYYDMTMVTFKNETIEDVFNEKLRDEIESRKIGFMKLWLGEPGFSTLQQTHQTTKIYNQGKLQYSILVHYAISADNVIAIIKTIPHARGTIHLINGVTAIIFTLAAIVISFIVMKITKKVTDPLVELKRVSQDLSRLSFRKIHIKTNDEIEELACSFNEMSETLQSAHVALEEKNRVMKDLLKNVSHEVKTPVALIKAYCSGIKDNIDDGTFLEEINIQNEKINVLIESLVTLNYLEQKQLIKKTTNLSDLVQAVYHDCKILAHRRELSLFIQIEPNLYSLISSEEIKLVLTNYITNAFKYSLTSINIRLYATASHIRFEMINDYDVSNDLNFEKIWETFYVGEKSRSKELSGTGLGLAICKAVLDNHQLEYGCKTCQNEIEFYIVFPNL